MQRTREIILKYGWNATAYQIINPGIPHWFSQSEDGLLEKANRELRDQFNIAHATLQLESGSTAHPCSLAAEDVV